MNKPRRETTVPSDTDILDELNRYQPNSVIKEIVASTPIINPLSPSYDKVRSSSINDFNENLEELTPDELRKNSKQETRLLPETVKVLSAKNPNEFTNLTHHQQFDLLFNDIQFLKNAATQGSLGFTNLRSISWMIFLELIPFDKSRWLTEIKRHRNVYDRLREEFILDPHAAQNFQDHPLAQDEQSSWNRFFQNNELKAMIAQDVHRIHRHNDFLKLESTHKSLIELLFVYVKFTNSEYRQGMHEILSTIMFVLYEDYIILSIDPDSSELVKEMANLDYLEHDSFTIFFAVMTTMYEWFSSKVFQPVSKKDQSSADNSKKLFVEEDDYENVIISKINYIRNVLLKDNDSELYFYFNKTDISLAPFGIRWLRLLFVRELEFPKCLILWDAIFAVDRNTFALADFIFVSLLMGLREQILKSDHSNCMKLLMQQHLHLTSLDVLQRALYLHNPEIYYMPQSMDDSYEYVPTNKNFENAYKHNTNNSKKDKTKRNSSTKPLQFDPTKMSKINENASSVSNSFSKPSRHSKTHEHEMKECTIKDTSKHAKELEMNLYNKISELKMENESLMMKFCELKEICDLCATNTDINIQILDKEVVKQELQSNEAIAVALKGFKEVRDQLSTIFKSDDKLMKRASISSSKNTYQSCSSLNSSDMQSSRSESNGLRMNQTANNISMSSSINENDTSKGDKSLNKDSEPSFNLTS